MPRTISERYKINQNNLKLSNEQLFKIWGSDNPYKYPQKEDQFLYNISRYNVFPFYKSVLMSLFYSVFSEDPINMYFLKLQKYETVQQKHLYKDFYQMKKLSKNCKTKRYENFVKYNLLDIESYSNKQYVINNSIAFSMELSTNRFMFSNVPMFYSNSCLGHSVHIEATTIIDLETKYNLDFRNFEFLKRIILCKKYIRKIEDVSIHQLNSVDYRRLNRFLNNHQTLDKAISLQPTPIHKISLQLNKDTKMELFERNYDLDWLMSLCPYIMFEDMKNI